MFVLYQLYLQLLVRNAELSLFWDIATFPLRLLFIVIHKNELWHDTVCISRGICNGEPREVLLPLHSLVKTHSIEGLSACRGLIFNDLDRDPSLHHCYFFLYFTLLLSSSYSLIFGSVHSSFQLAPPLISNARVSDVDTPPPPPLFLLPPIISPTNLQFGSFMLLAATTSGYRMFAIEIGYRRVPPLIINCKYEACQMLTVSHCYIVHFFITNNIRLCKKRNDK